MKELGDSATLPKFVVGSEDAGRLQSCLNIADGGDSLGVNARLTAMERQHKNSMEEIAKKLATLTDMVKRPGRNNVTLNNTENRGSKSGTNRDESRTRSFADAVRKDTDQAGSGATLRPPDPVLQMEREIYHLNVNVMTIKEIGVFHTIEASKRKNLSLSRGLQN